MGMFDTVVIFCATCGEKTQSQTKILGGNTLSAIKIGDKVTNDYFRYRDCVVELKEKCEHCGSANCIVIKKGIISTVKKGRANIKEYAWGEVE